MKSYDIVALCGFAAMASAAPPMARFLIGVVLLFVAKYMESRQ